MFCRHRYAPSRLNGRGEPVSKPPNSVHKPPDNLRSDGDGDGDGDGDVLGMGMGMGMDPHGGDRFVPD